LTLKKPVDAILGSFCQFSPIRFSPPNIFLILTEIPDISLIAEKFADECHPAHSATILMHPSPSNLEH